MTGVIKVYILKNIYKNVYRSCFKDFDTVRLEIENVVLEKSYEIMEDVIFLFYYYYYFH